MKVSISTFRRLTHAMCDNIADVGVVIASVSSPCAVLSPRDMAVAAVTPHAQVEEGIVVTDSTEKKQFGNTRTAIVSGLKVCR